MHHPKFEPQTVAVRQPPENSLVVPAEKAITAIHDIAIIGVIGRYPQANDLNQFWDNLKAGKDSIIEIPADRWDKNLYFDQEQSKRHHSCSKWGGFLDDIDKFDALFFNISPAEAKQMDPQERLFLETAWQVIEDAGYSNENIAAQKVGVFVGVMYGQYQLLSAEESVTGKLTANNSIFASIANRVSYCLNLHGPSLAVDTMCSSSLTALHYACLSIRNGECALAIAGGINLAIHPNKYLLLGGMNVLSSDGRCKSFGADGDGMVPAEGVGAVLLKPLTLALADNDNIYGVIKGSSINHGGKVNGYTVPNPVAHAELITLALNDANVEPETISYVEAHGTGTPLGDPIEIAGLTKAFGYNAVACAIGSLKSNMGHAEFGCWCSRSDKSIITVAT